MHDDRDPLREAVYRCAEYGGGQPMTIDVPENATIAPTDDIGSHMLACATTSWWID